MRTVRIGPSSLMMTRSVIRQARLVRN
jgi:hypothetical protein